MAGLGNPRISWPQAVNLRAGVGNPAIVISRGPVRDCTEDKLRNELDVVRCICL